MLDFIFRKKTGFLLLVILSCALGGVLISRLPIQLYPQTQRPRVRVSISHPGYTAVDFSTQYADSIESQLLAVEGVDILEVQYRGDRSDFSLTFNWEVDSEEAKADVESAMNTIKTVLPQDFQDSYSVRFFSGENAGFLMLGVSSDLKSPEEMYSILKTSVEPRLNQVEDAEIIEIFNVEDLQVDVFLRQIDMLNFGVTISDVDSALRSGYLPESIGTLSEGETSYSVRFSKGVDSLYGIGDIVITNLGNMRVRLEDIADISIYYTLPRQTFLMDGKKGIQVIATPIDGGNIRKLTQEVSSILDQAILNDVLPSDTQLNLYLDPGEYIDRSINSVVRAALIGSGLAMLIVLLILGVLRNTLLIGISLPVTLILSFILMYIFDVSLNLISLGGMALAVGMVIDSSIVVMENIHRFRMEEGEIQKNKKLKKLILQAVEQVRSPVIASILTSVLVFLPISFTAPLTNAILGDQAKVVIFALLFSMVIALTLIPLVAYMVYRVGRGRNTKNGSGATLRGLQRLSVPVLNFFVSLYKKMLRGLLSKRWAVLLFIALSFGMLLFSVVRVLPLIPKEIISPPSSDRIIVFLRSTTDISHDEMINRVIPDIDRQVRDRVGEYIEGTYAEIRGHFNRFFVNVSDARNADFVMGELQDLFVSDNQWYFHVMKWDPAQLPLPRTMDLQIGIKGEDEGQIVALLEQTRDIINSSELYGWAFTQPSTSFSNELVLTSRSEIFDSTSNFSEATLLNLIRRLLRGTSSMEFEEDGITVSVSAEYEEEVVGSREKLQNFLIPFRTGTIPLKHFFNFQEKTGISEIVSENGERIFRVYAKMRPDTPAANRELYEAQIREKLEQELELPAGYSLVFENPQVEMDNAIRSLFLALAVSVALIYLLLAFQFNSLSIPLIILVTVPLGFIGVVFSLYVFKSTLSLNSLLGAILLSGIVVNNAIIMIDFYLKTLSGYKNRIEAVVQTAGIRFPPIIITMLTTIFGMLPIAIGMGEGSNIVQPLGIAVSGGLFFSTLFTLFMVPSILSLLKLKKSLPE